MHNSFIAFSGYAVLFDSLITSMPRLNFFSQSGNAWPQHEFFFNARYMMFDEEDE